MQVRLHYARQGLRNQSASIRGHLGERSHGKAGYRVVIRRRAPRAPSWPPRLAPPPTKLLPAISETRCVNKTAVIGSGSWGTTLAVLVAEAHGNCALWAHDPAEAHDMAARRENVRFLPGVTLPDTLHIEHDPAAVLRNADLVLLTVPMRRLRENWDAVAHLIEPHAAIVSGIKGLDPATGRRVSEFVVEWAGDEIRHRLAVLSGPNLAREIAAGEPATAVIAARVPEVGRTVQQRLSAPTFRTYVSDDVIGIELAGAIKNVIAIGAGVADGLRFGDNAKAALMTRGLAEMTRLGLTAGADALTFAGLAGMGDLIATCASPHSRNHYVGQELAAGRTLDDIQSRMVMVAEGVETSRGALALARRLGVEMPIVELINRALFDGLPVAEAGQVLMARELSHELRGLRRDD
ncbi:MAG: NAD(P)-dependent glycerol-3-phosphate dehydrogenase [Chloroflexi bacterium]|nr:NAD(P)-dependent glycerol-3-phosphate dehydrogenase [Chloroflexota bacterium]